MYVIHLRPDLGARCNQPRSAWRAWRNTQSDEGSKGQEAQVGHKNEKSHHGNNKLPPASSVCCAVPQNFTVQNMPQKKSYHGEGKQQSVTEQVPNLGFGVAVVLSTAYRFEIQEKQTFAARASDTPQPRTTLNHKPPDHAEQKQTKQPGEKNTWSGTKLVSGYVCIENGKSQGMHVRRDEQSTGNVSTPEVGLGDPLDPLEPGREHRPGVGLLHALLIVESNTVGCQLQAARHATNDWARSARGIFGDGLGRGGSGKRRSTKEGRSEMLKWRVFDLWSYFLSRSRHE